MPTIVRRIIKKTRRVAWTVTWIEGEVEPGAPQVIDATPVEADPVPAPDSEPGPGLPTEPKRVRKPKRTPKKGSAKPRGSRRKKK